MINDGTRPEVGDRIITGKEPIRFFEMNLKRVGDTTCPSKARCFTRLQIPTIAV